MSTIQPDASSNDSQPPDPSVLSTTESKDEEAPVSSLPPSITIDPFDALSQLCNQLSAIAVPYSNTEQSAFNASIAATQLALNNSNASQPSQSLQSSSQSSQSSQVPPTPNNSVASLHNTATSNTTDSNISDNNNIDNNNGNENPSSSTDSIRSSSFGTEVIKSSDNNTNTTTNNNNNIYDYEESSPHATISLISNMSELIGTLSNTLDETLIRLEELQSIGLDQLQPAIEECGKRADYGISNNDINNINLLENKYNEIIKCFEQIEAVEELISAIDLNLSQHEWRFQKLRGIYAEELNLPPQSVSAVNDSIATMEEFELISQGASNLQKKMNMFSGWVVRGVKDTAEKVATKSKEMPKKMGNSVRRSVGNLFTSNGNGRSAILYDGYAEAKEDVSDKDNENNDNKNGDNSSNAVDSGNDNVESINGVSSGKDEDENEKTWPLKPEEIRERERRNNKSSKNPFGGFGSLRNVTFAGAMGKLKNNINNIGNITKRKGNENEKDKDKDKDNQDYENGVDDNEIVNKNDNNEDGDEQKKGFNIRNVFKIKDKNKQNELEGDELLNWRPEKLPDIDALLQRKKAVPESKANGGDKSLLSSGTGPSKRMKKDSVGSDSSGGSHQLP